MKTFIYGLVDPRTLLVRYVGLSSTGMRRPLDHRSKAAGEDTHKARWIKLLAVAGYTYEIVVLEVVEKVALKAAERWWIVFGRACGWPLTNLTDGGDGLSGHVFSLEHRAKIGAARRGLIRSSEVREKIAAALRGKKRSAESIVKQLESRKGYSPSVETRAKMRASNLGKKRPPSVGIAVAASNKRRALKEWLT